MFPRFKSFFNPEQYHGWGKKCRYFEGWYFKLINADETAAFAFIPGVAMDNDGKRQSFIQVLNGYRTTADYHRFEFADFHPTEGKFEVKILENYFSEHRLKLDLPNIKGELELSGNVPWPKPWYSPGIMGPFAFVPFMECYHDIVSMNHHLTGYLDINNEKVDFTGGRGYLEKDWGRSFPSAYFWMQSNHFSQPDISFKASVAKIPFMGRFFVGFISGLWLQDHLIRFTTYNGTQLRKSFADAEKVEIVLENRQHRLEIIAHRSTSTALASPIHGFMDGRIEESMTAKINLQLTDKQENKIIFEDIGRNASLEVAGKIKEIMIPAY